MKSPIALMLLTLLTIATVGCGSSSAPTTMPEALYGSWEGGNNLVTSVRFSEGGRITINESCAGEYRLGAVDSTIATLSTGYIDCPGVMDGHIPGVTVSIEAESLVFDGSKLNGSYVRATQP